MARPKIAPENNTHKADILEAARLLYLKEGYNSLSMRKVADLAGISAAYIYTYYVDKEDLLYALATESVEIFGTYLKKAAEEKDVFLRFLAGGHAYRDFAIERPQYYRLIFMLPEAWLSVEKRADIQKLYDQSISFFEQNIRDCIECNIIKPEISEGLAELFWATAHGMNILYLDGKIRLTKIQYRDFYDNGFRKVFKGVLQEKETWKITKND